MTAPYPGQASADATAFEHLFASAAGVARVSAFWRAKFRSLGEELTDATWSTTWLNKILTVPDQPLDAAAADRVNATDSVMREAGCLLSFAELSKATLGSSDPDQARAALMGVAKGTPKGPPQESSRLLRLVRETFDAVRRLSTGEALAGRFGLETSEALALIRQEAAFVVPPTTDTYELAPLVSTGPGCRNVNTSWLGLPSFNHDYFNTAYRCVEVRPISDAQVGSTMRFDLGFHNLLFSGLDIIAHPALPDGDDLTAIAFSAWTASNAPRSVQNAARTAGASVHHAARGTLAHLALGFLMNQVASEGGVPKRSPENLLEAATNRVVELIDAHPAKLVGENVVLQSAGRETDLILSEMCQWYASRRWWRTLLPIQVQSLKPELAPGAMSPFLTYLRFHTGDEIFVGILLRLLAQLKDIRRRVTPPLDNHARAVAAAIGQISQRAPVMPIDDLAKTWLDSVWKRLGNRRPPNATSGVRNRASWRHLGLAAAWVGQVPWLQRFPENPESRDAGLVVTEFVSAADEMNLYPYLEACLHHIRVDDLVPRVVIPGNRQALVNCHSFERYRTFLTEQGLDRAV